jgi:ABC-type transport system involved in cytochrome bd biosynthesis fused ATPase/permease subunit
MLKRIVWFSLPEAGYQSGRAADARHLSRWQRWCDSAHADDVRVNNKERLHRSVFKALRRDVFLAFLAITVNAGCAFGAAITLKSLIQQLTQPGTPLAVNLALGITCMLLTLSAWVALNHSFLLADLAGIGARTYIEQRLLRKKHCDDRSNQPFGFTTLFDREAARVEAAWSGVVFMALALATIAFTAVFFFMALGPSALSALSIIVVGSIVIFRIAKRLNEVHSEQSARSADRIEVASFSLNNRLLAWLKNWSDELIRRYTHERRGEEQALKKAARLVALINLISTLTPIIAMLAAAVTQLAVVGHVDPAGVLSAMALIGGLRSVANNVPEIVQSISQGMVGHRNVSNYLSDTGESSADSRTVQLPTTSAKHIAVVGAAGSGKTSVLKAAARMSSRDRSATVFIPDEPWVFPGGLRENLRLYRADFSDDDAREAIRLSRLPETFYAEYLESDSRKGNAGWDISRGQGKRLEIARAILAEPSCIFIDQPTSGLNDDLAHGLLSSLLRGRWQNATVVFATDKQDEMDAAQEIWVVADGAVVEVKPNLTAPRLDPFQETTRPGSTSEERTLPRQSTDGEDPSECRRSLRRSVINLGLAKVALVALGLFVCREVLTIVGEYITASGLSTSNARTSMVTLVCILSVGAVLSISGALLVVQSSIRAASRQCISYFTNIMSPTLDRSISAEVNKDSQSKLTWDQRRVDEVFPVVLLHSLSAATFLVTTVGFVLSKNVLVLLPFAGMCFAYWHSSRRSGDRLQYFNDREISTTSILFAQVEAFTWRSSRFDFAKDNSVLVSWLNKSLMNRTFASMDNARARQWFVYKLYLIGLAFLSVIVGSTVLMHAYGRVGLANVLALSLCYSLIAVFARVGTCLVELRQVLDSADRLLTRPVNAEPDRACATLSGDGARVSFSDVTFVAPQSNALLLESFTESFHRGDVVVITGASGVGKSTLAKLVVGGLQPTKGVVSTLGRTTGYVSKMHKQDILLLTSSPVFKPGKLSEHFNDPEDAKLARMVDFLELGDVLARIPGGFDELVPSTGWLNLSKTELQRLALLDALVNPPAIAILDEATSSLNSDAERSLLRSVTSALPDTLFFIITHNPSLRELGDRVFHFTDERRLVEIHDEVACSSC